ncbi:MAG TPA: DUF4349 domain-containing protein [Jatrophihabitans sp.]|nr:DUF4349 domain-containing protein [Jatrophihabitans sp.]
MRRRTTAVAAAAMIALLAVAACSHEGGSPGGSAVAGGAPAAEGETRAGSAPGAPGAPAHLPAAPAHGVPMAQVMSTAQIRTAQIVVAVTGARNVAATADAAAAIAVRAGGEVYADDRTSGPHATANMSLRVPPNALLPTLSKLSKLGVEQHRRVSTTDVTQRVADVASRTASAQQEIARLRKLYARATKISDIITIESELASREANLEALEAQARALASRTALATIDLALVTAAVHRQPAPPAKPRASGFIGGLERGWHAFAALASWLALVLGAVLPFLLLALLLAGAGRLVWTRILRRARVAPTGPPSE